MRFFSLLLILVQAAFILSCQSEEQIRTSELEECILSRINETRLSNASAALGSSDQLADVARAHSEDMDRRDFFSHTTPEGVTFDERINDAGIDFLKAGENIYRRVNPQMSEIPVESLAMAVVGAWLASEGHRENMLDVDYNEAGVGCCMGDDVLYVTLDLITTP